jgi:hypothetical protein
LITSLLGCITGLFSSSSIKPLSSPIVSMLSSAAGGELGFLIAFEAAIVY